MLEGLIISAGPLLIKEIFNAILPEMNLYLKIGMLLVSIYIYTLIILTYRCKFKTPSKPTIKFSNALYPTLVFLVYYVALIVMSYIPHFVVQRVRGILSFSIVYFLISWLVYYNMLQASHPDCFEMSIVAKIFGFIGGILGKIF
jgi:hypothetical protein